MKDQSYAGQAGDAGVTLSAMTARAETFGQMTIRNRFQTKGRIRFLATMKLGAQGSGDNLDGTMDQHRASV